MNNAEGFGWLHFSDLHVGVKEQGRLLPRFRKNLDDDLKKVIDKSGEVDVIFFTGDLVQSGARAEFSLLDDVLSEILANIEKLQKRPALIAIPGNHDLERPDPLRPESVALAEYWRNEKLREYIWSERDSGYRDFLNESFSNFTEWQDRAIASGLHLAPHQTGLMAGDASYKIQKSGFYVGVVGLNSAWLQLAAGDYFGNLHVDVSQILSVTGGSPDSWSKGNLFNFILTHHPSAWLKRLSPASWQNDINSPDRFDMHLFGHMHEPLMVSKSIGGGVAERLIQAASLFGLERTEGGIQRIQGYSANTVGLASGRKLFKSWPRRLVEIGGGSLKLAPDSSYDLDEETSSYTLPYDMPRGSEATEPAAAGRVNAAPAQLIAGVDLTSIRFNPTGNLAHSEVRKVEQKLLLESLASDGVAWICCDWGLGWEGFVETCCDGASIGVDRVFLVDLSDFQGRSSDLDLIKARLGFGFEQICSSIDGGEMSLLIFDDINFTSDSSEERAKAAAIESLARVAIEFSSNIKVIIRARRLPRAIKFRVIELRPLDEADLAAYVRGSNVSNNIYLKPEAIEKIFRHTDGLPHRVDEVVRDLKFFSLDDLVSSNSDFLVEATGSFNAPAALVATVQELAVSEDRVEKRAHAMLLALSALPQGEQLTRIKRILGPHPLSASHARVLIDR